MNWLLRLIGLRDDVQREPEITVSVAESPAPAAIKNTLELLPKGSNAWYREAWRQVQFDAGYESKIERDALLVLSGKSRYLMVASIAGVPWWVIGCIHLREAACDFSGCFHNGEKIIGKGLRTKLIPRNRGPFKTWEESAHDALLLTGLIWKEIRAGRDDIAEILRAVERYNGVGYLRGAGRLDNSPYLWARTNINDGYGRYVADGKYDPRADANRQSGFAAVAKRLELMGEIQVRV